MSERDVLREALTPDQSHSPDYNRGWGDGNASALDACNPIIQSLQARLAALALPAEPALDVERLARAMTGVVFMDEAENRRLAAAILAKLDASDCDHCLDGNVAVDGWHTVVDPEGVEGTSRIPCTRR